MVYKPNQKNHHAVRLSLTQSILSFGGHLEGILSAIVAKRDMVVLVGRSCHEDLQKRGSR